MSPVWVHSNGVVERPSNFRAIIIILGKHGKG